MNSIFILKFFLALSLCSVFSVFTMKVAIKLKILDNPIGGRKIHESAVPLLGGIAVFISFFIVLFFSKQELLAGNLSINHWLGFFGGACFLMIGGFLDDKYSLKPKKQIIWPILATICVIIGGVEIQKITNPLGGFFYLDTFKLSLFEFNGVFYSFVVISDIVVVFWLMGMMYTTKLLDGVDGLVTGMTGIGAFIIFLFTMTTKYYQPDIGLAALVLAGVCLGFLVFNWHPAKIFLGEGGSLLLGYLLGVLAIISGGKIAITLLIMGLPIMDVAWTILRRIRAGKNPFKFSDRKHLHFRLLDLGFSQKKTVLIYYSFALLFGLSALFLQSFGKIFALGVLIVFMLFIIFGFNYLDNKKSKQIN